MGGTPMLRSRHQAIGCSLTMQLADLILTSDMHFEAVWQADVNI